MAWMNELQLTIVRLLPML